MRILAFTIGQHYLGLPADQVGSVGRRDLSQDKKKRSGRVLEYNLGQAMSVAVGSCDRVISCNLDGREMNLLVEKIIGLVDLKEEALVGWPAILDRIPLFCGVGTTDTVMYLLLDLAKVSRLKGRE